MSLPEEASAPETSDQIVEWIAGLSDTELTDALTRHELSVGGTRAEKYRRLKRQLLLYRGLSDRSSVSDLASNAIRGSENDVRGSGTYRNVSDSTEVPVLVRAPVTVMARAYGYANILYTGPRDSFHLLYPIFPPMRLSRVSVETAEEDARPGMVDIPPSEEHRVPCFLDTVRGEQYKLYRGKDFSPLIPPAAPHSTLDASNSDRLDLSGDRVPSMALERFARTHSGPEVPSGCGGVVGDGRLDLHLNLDTNLETINQTAAPDEFTRGPNRTGYDSKGGMNCFSLYEADFRPLSFDGDPEPRTQDYQGQYNRPLSNSRERYSERHQEEIRRPVRGNLEGCPENRGLGLSSSRFKARQEIQDMSRFVCNWKISFTGKSGVSAEDFLTRLEECRGITPIKDDDLLRALPMLLQDVALLWFWISKDEWRNWSEFKTAFRRRFFNYDFAARVREQIFNRTQGQKESVDDYLTYLRGLIAMLRDKVPLAEQLDWAYRGLRPEFKKVIRKFEFRDFNELTQIGRSWEMAWAAAKEYRPPPSPENSFLPEFAYRAETTPAAHKRTPVSDVTKTAPPLRISGGLDFGCRNTEDRGKRNGNRFMNNGRQTGFTKDKSKGSDYFESNMNFKGTKDDLKVGGGQQRPSTSVEKTPIDLGKEMEVICFRCQKRGHFQKGCALPRKIACYRCKAEGYTIKNCPNCSRNGEKKQ